MTTVHAAEPKSVGERCLLGWMPREDAIKHLTEESLEPLFDARNAAEIWAEYRRRVEELPQREALAPERLSLTTDEQGLRSAFLRKHQGAPTIQDVIKIDPRRCVALQLSVITDRAEMYAATTKSAQHKARHCLGSDQNQAVSLTITPAVNAIRVALPHAEFTLAVAPNGSLVFQQLARHISVSAFDNRMLLFAGYHRAFALSALHNPDAIERSLVVALTTDAAPLLSSDSPNQTVREMVRGLRPPLFADFFDDCLFMSLRVRKRRPELWIQPQIKWFDDPS
jgi:hypothetical protein